MAKTFFITGTGTGVGKTIITCSLMHQMREAKLDSLAIKPLISGWEDNVTTNDTLQILTSMHLPFSQENIEKISPWIFSAPLSPSMAARKENITIIYNDIINFVQHSSIYSEYMLIEGAGGVMSPITDNKTNLDLISDLNIPAILVASTYLGSISHTLTAITAIEERAKIHSIIVSESDNGIGLDETIFELKNFTNIPIHGLKRTTTHEGFIWQKTDDLLACIF